MDIQAILTLVTEGQEIARMEMGADGDAAQVLVTSDDTCRPRALLGLLALGLHSLARKLDVQNELPDDWLPALALLLETLEGNELALLLDVSHEREMES